MYILQSFNSIYFIYFVYFLFWYIVPCSCSYWKEKKSCHVPCLQFDPSSGKVMISNGMCFTIPADNCTGQWPGRDPGSFWSLFWGKRAFVKLTPKLQIRLPPKPILVFRLVFLCFRFDYHPWNVSYFSLHPSSKSNSQTTPTFELELGLELFWSLICSFWASHPA